MPEYLSSCLLRLPHLEHLPVSSLLSSKPFVVWQPFSLFGILFLSLFLKASSLLFFDTLSFYLTAGLKVRSLLNEKLCQQSVTRFVLPPLQYNCSQYCLFYQQLNCVTPSFFSLQCSISACLFFARGLARQIEQRQLKHLLCQQCWRELITMQ